MAASITNHSGQVARSLIVLVGSTRPAKIDAVRAAIEAIAGFDSRFADARVEAMDVGDVAPRMPTTDRETLEGARARAEAVGRQFVRTQVARESGRNRSASVRAGGGAPAQLETMVLALGLEGGIAQLPIDDGKRQAIVTWAAATDGKRWGYGGGGTILLPDDIARQVLAGRELGDVIDALAGGPVRGTRGAWGVFTRDLVGRRDAFRVATIAALAPFYNPGPYAPD